MPNYRKRFDHSSFPEQLLKDPHFKSIFLPERLGQPLKLKNDLEEDYAVLMEFNHQVIGFLEAPVKLPVGQSSYVPGMLIVTLGGQLQLCDIRPSTDPLFADAELLSNLNKAAKNFGCNYVRKDELDIRVLNGAYLKNLKLIFPYRDVFDTNKISSTNERLASKQLDAVYSWITYNGPISLDEVINYFKAKMANEELIFIYVFYMLANDFITTNLHAPLELSSLLRKGQQS